MATFFIISPAWHSWKFDLAGDLGENISHAGAVGELSLPFECRYKYYILLF